MAMANMSKQVWPGPFLFRLFRLSPRLCQPDIPLHRPEIETNFHHIFSIWKMRKRLVQSKLEKSSDFLHLQFPPSAIGPIGRALQLHFSKSIWPNWPTLADLGRPWPTLADLGPAAQLRRGTAGCGFSSNVSAGPTGSSLGCR